MKTKLFFAFATLYFFFGAVTVIGNPIPQNSNNYDAVTGMRKNTGKAQKPSTSDKKTENKQEKKGTDTKSKDNAKSGKTAK
jgi:hypothetical protein